MDRYNKCFAIIQNFDENNSNKKWIWKKNRLIKKL